MATNEPPMDYAIKFRASSVGNLLVGGNAITSRQRERLRELLARKNDPDAKPLTANMEKEMVELVDKRDSEFEFGATARSYIRDCWLRNEYGYEEPVLTNEMLKGLTCEDEAIGVLSRQVPGGFRVKNEQHFSNDWFTGTPDVILSDAIEDVKCSWTLKTFVAVERPNPIYYAQGQVYMDLTGRSVFRLCHVLVETPENLVREELKRYFFRFDCDEENPHYLECCHKVEAMHNIAGIPEEQRIRVFEFPYNELYMLTLRKRVEQARGVYNSLTLGGVT